jgi:NADH dehydrogenase
VTGRITVFGGTGFIGRHLVSLLLRNGTTVRVVARHPDRFQVATEATRAPELIQADVLDDSAVSRAIAGADVVINLVGILPRRLNRPIAPFMSEALGESHWPHIAMA